MSAARTGPAAIDPAQIRAWLVKNVLFTFLSAALILMAAGTIAWTAAWIFLGLVVAGQVAIAVIVGRRHPDLLVERGGVGEGAKRWDLPLALGMTYAPLAVWIVAGLQLRFSWEPTFPPAIQAVGFGVAALGMVLNVWAMAANRFFAPVVRIQRDRDHTVATEGPYRFVRHPGYLGAIALDVGSAILLGSPWALLPAAATAAIVVVRTSLEDWILRRELGGYEDYAGHVRHRLVPGLW